MVNFILFLFCLVQGNMFLDLLCITSKEELVIPFAMIWKCYFTVIHFIDNIEIYGFSLFYAIASEQFFGADKSFSIRPSLTIIEGSLFTTTIAQPGIHHSCFRLVRLRLATLNTFRI